ncbi:LysE family translocator [Aggregicoccus sp. 17bor-14]|uniref:LysE family translocator n=1 Tax=Myxococcaceae TaxID=31 RepID=UPI00129C283E|nr:MULTISPECIES: LysE family translocator [Myxococcaceae]MBF5045086.1 LysE family translocator [Simulacricoccus sp. 17bor-14]MRI90828.1 LysE family translocator [Aggregicoccus sp. 17bor-14]
MVSWERWVGFALVALGMVCTPGPNMLYLVSRSVTQGRRAGLVSLAGIVLGFVFYLFAAALGITAVLLAVPYGYEALKLAGAAYLLFLAVKAVRGSGTVFAPQQLSIDAPRRLFGMGLLTSLLNPKVAVLYLSLLPQFIDAGRGGIFAQSLVLGSTQIAVSATVNTLIVWSAGTVAGWFQTRPSWVRVQRYLMGSVLGGLAVRLALEHRPG